MYACSGCFSSTHAAPVFASHVAKPLESAKLAQLSNCPEHGSSEMEFWCDTCSKGVCQVCCQSHAPSISPLIYRCLRDFDGGNGSPDNGAAVLRCAC